MCVDRVSDADTCRCVPASIAALRNALLNPPVRNLSSPPPERLQAMRVMNRRMNLPNLQNIMREFERQNERMEMTSEMMGDAVDDALQVRGQRVGSETEGVARVPVRAPCARGACESCPCAHKPVCCILQA